MSPELQNFYTGAAINEDRKAALIGAYCTDVTVNRMMDCGSPLEAIIAQLVIDKEALLKEIMNLSSIAPWKMRMPDGRVMVYRCPDELIPERTVSGGDL